MAGIKKWVSLVMAMVIAGVFFVSTIGAQTPPEDSAEGDISLSAEEGWYLPEQAARVFTLTNAERTNAGLHTLGWDAQLAQAAQIRARELVESFSHTRPNGESVDSLMGKPLGENIAGGHKNADMVMAAWMQSSGHKTNILHQKYSSFGTACYEQNGVRYWVQLFSFDQTAAGTDDPVDTSAGPATTAGFITRLYQTCLLRQPDADGLAYWQGQIDSGAYTGSGIATYFFLGAEFVARNYSDEAYVERLYTALMGREADTEGKRYWVQCLREGVSRRGLLASFVQSREYGDICGQYGIWVGQVEVTESRDQKPDLTRFVNRLYTYVLGRAGEADGLNHWCGKGLDEGYSAYRLAENFVFSTEFERQGHSDESYVRVLYRAFMGREAEADGMAYWVEMLRNGNKTRREVFHGFASSEEFRLISQNFGVKPV